jgi:hypothetical protein
MVAALVAGLLSIVGCQKKDEAPKAAGLGPSGAAPPAAAAPPVQAPAQGPMAAPAAFPAAAPAAAATGATITGKITVAPARKGDVSPNDVIYLTARRMPDTPGTRGSLVAVKRFTAAALPIPFTLGESDMMFKNGNFEGLLQLTVRVDKDGDPMTHKKGDLFGVLDNVKVGSAGVDLALTSVQTEDESLAGPMQGAGAPGQGSMPGLPPGHP